MIGFIGYNFCADGNALDPTPTNVNNITATRLQNGIFDHFNVTRNVTFDYSSIIPIDWDIDTIMDANFKGNISAGNVDIAGSSGTVTTKAVTIGPSRNISVIGAEDTGVVIRDFS